MLILRVSIGSSLKGQEMFAVASMGGIAVLLLIGLVMHIDNFLVPS